MRWNQVLIKQKLLVSKLDQITVRNWPKLWNLINRKSDPINENHIKSTKFHEISRNWVIQSTAIRIQFMKINSQNLGKWLTEWNPDFSKF